MLPCVAQIPQRSDIIGTPERDIEFTLDFPVAEGACSAWCPLQTGHIVCAWNMTAELVLPFWIIVVLGADCLDDSGFKRVARGGIFVLLLFHGDMLHGNWLHGNRLHGHRLHGDWLHLVILTS